MRLEEALPITLLLVLLSSPCAQHVHGRQHPPQNLVGLTSPHKGFFTARRTASCGDFPAAANYYADLPAGSSITVSATSLGSTAGLALGLRSGGPSPGQNIVACADRGRKTERHVFQNDGSRERRVHIAVGGVDAFTLAWSIGLGFDLDALAEHEHEHGHGEHTDVLSKVDPKEEQDRTTYCFSGDSLLRQLGYAFVQASAAASVRWHGDLVLLDESSVRVLFFWRPFIQDQDRAAAEMSAEGCDVIVWNSCFWQLRSKNPRIFTHAERRLTQLMRTHARMLNATKTAVAAAAGADVFFYAPHFPRLAAGDEAHEGVSMQDAFDTDVGLLGRLQAQGVRVIRADRITEAAGMGGTEDGRHYSIDVMQRILATVPSLRNGPQGAKRRWSLAEKEDTGGRRRRGRRRGEGVDVPLLDAQLLPLRQFWDTRVHVEDDGVDAATVEAALDLVSGLRMWDDGVERSNKPVVVLPGEDSNISRLPRPAAATTSSSLDQKSVNWHSRELLDADVLPRLDVDEVAVLNSLHATLESAASSFLGSPALVTNVWANVNGRGSGNIVHDHGGSVVSGVLYLDGGTSGEHGGRRSGSDRRTGGRTVFLDPRSARHCNGIAPRDALQFLRRRCMKQPLHASATGGEERDRACDRAYACGILDRMRTRAQRRDGEGGDGDDDERDRHGAAPFTWSEPPAATHDSSEGGVAHQHQRYRHAHEPLRPGRLMLWPACLAHGVEPHRGPGLRVSLSFNVQPLPFESEDDVASASDLRCEELHDAAAAEDEELLLLLRCRRLTRWRVALEQRLRGGNRASAVLPGRESERQRRGIVAVEESESWWPTTLLGFRLRPHSSSAKNTNRRLLSPALLRRAIARAAAEAGPGRSCDDMRIVDIFSPRRGDAAAAADAVASAAQDLAALHSALLRASREHPTLRAHETNDVHAAKRRIVARPFGSCGAEEDGCDNHRVVESEKEDVLHARAWSLPRDFVPALAGVLHLPDETRQPQQRRMDWELLLPDPRPAVGLDYGNASRRLPRAFRWGHEDVVWSSSGLATINDNGVAERSATSSLSDEMGTAGAIDDDIVGSGLLLPPWLVPSLRFRLAGATATKASSWASASCGLLFFVSAK